MCVGREGGSERERGEGRKVECDESRDEEGEKGKEKRKGGK